jgi:hypothetical protein
MFLADEDEYELLPKHELEDLKKEIEHLKKNPFGEAKEGESLLEAINNLNDNIKRLIDIFASAGTDLQKDYSETNPIEDLQAIKGQNEQIAQGIVTVAGILTDMKGDLSARTDAEAPERPLRLGPRIPMIRPGLGPEPVQRMPYQSSQGYPLEEPLPDDFSDQIPPPPPQTMQGMNGPMGAQQPMGTPSFGALPDDKKRRGLFSRR